MEIHGTAVILNNESLLLLLVNLLKVPTHSAFVSLLISRDVVITIMIIVITLLFISSRTFNQYMLPKLSIL